MRYRKPSRLWREREFWTSFAVRREVEVNYGDASVSTTISLTGFFRNLTIEYRRPWDRRVGE